MVVTRRQLTHTQWKFIEPYLPIGRYGPYPERLREQFGGDLAAPVQWSVAGDACRVRPLGHRPWTFPRLAGRRCLRRALPVPYRPRLVADAVDKVGRPGTRPGETGLATTPST